MPVPIPQSEPKRIAALRACDILDTAEEDIYERITESAADACNAPIALISFIDDDRQWCKSHYGVPWNSTTRELSICAHTILGDNVMIVKDTLHDERFCRNPLVTDGERIRFYAGFPLRSGDGHAIGTLCVLDTKPRSLEGRQLDTLRKLTDGAMCLLNLRKRHGSALFAAAVDTSSDAIAIATVAEKQGTIIYVNKSFLNFCQCKYHEVIGRSFTYPCPDSLRPALETALHKHAPVTKECEYELNGEKKFDGVTVVPYMNELAEVIYCVVVHRDLTAGKQAEAQRQQIHAMKTTVRSVNHVILNFLNTAALFQQDMEGVVERSKLIQFQLSIENTRAQMLELASMEEFRERSTPFGFTVLDPPK